MSSSVSTNNKIILGIDPGFGRVGWGVVEYSGGDIKHLAHGCIETNTKDSFVDRLVEIQKDLETIINKYQPEIAGVEDLFFYKNVTTAIKVSQARGVILLSLVNAGVAVEEFTPLQIKQSLTGYGRAEKGQIQKMVQMELGLAKKPSPDDAADALAVAITCAVSMKMRQLSP